jgi:pimeloyl-ACP methyl ester carboxylesterase
LLAALVLAASIPAAAATRVGIVMLHGLGGVPLGSANARGFVVGGTLIPALRRAGYLVATPELCYASRRMYDRAFTDCFADVDAAVAALRAQGATTIVVGGESLGALMAFAYASIHPDVVAVVACAPAGDAVSKRAAGIRNAVTSAQAAVDAGRGDVVQAFPETNTGRYGREDFTVRTTPRIYLSFHDPDGPANLEMELSRVNAPVLWLAGSRDRTQPGAPPDALNVDPRTTFLVIDSDHLSTPDVGTPAILAWLRGVVPQQ